MGSKQPLLTIMYSELGQVLKQRRLALRYSRGDVAKLVFGTEDLFWKLTDLEAGKIRTTPDSVECIQKLVKFYRITQKERKLIHFDRDFPRISREIELRLNGAQTFELRGILKHSRYAPRT